MAWVQNRPGQGTNSLTHSVILQPAREPLFKVDLSVYFDIAVHAGCLEDSIEASLLEIIYSGKICGR